MNLAHAYAQLIKDAPEGKAGVQFADRVLAYMKAKGHMSLLPRVLKIVQRLPNANEAVVVVKSEADLAKLKTRIKDSLKELGTEEKPNILVDSRIVGGYLARFGGKVIDKSFRSALTAVYHKSIS